MSDLVVMTEPLYSPAGLVELSKVRFCMMSEQSAVVPGEFKIHVFGLVDITSFFIHFF